MTNVDVVHRNRRGNDTLPVSVGTKDFVNLPLLVIRIVVSKNVTA